VFQENGKELDFDTAVASGASVGVPGTVRGWHEALERYGTMSFKQVLAPAIDVATKGFPVSETFHKLTTENERKFQQFGEHQRALPENGKAIPAGTTLKNPGHGQGLPRDRRARLQGLLRRARWRGHRRRRQPPPLAGGARSAPAT
jgi:gamma-glutamyltranspeptidase